MYKHILLLCALLCSTLTHAAEDLIVNGGTTTIASGDHTYGTIFITNEGLLDIRGTILAEEVIIDNGELMLHGVLSAETFWLKKGLARIGDAQAGPVPHTIQTVTIESGCTLRTYGTWNIKSLLIRDGGILQIAPRSSGLNRSGGLNLISETFMIESGGILDGHGAGNDGTGTGGGWIESGGGGYGGKGGLSVWAQGGNSRTYGTEFGFDIHQGSRGKFFGGGSLILYAESFTLDGHINLNGISSSGGGAGSGGGGLFVIDTILSFTGLISANGGDGNSNSGAGGGGRIKIFHEEEFDSTYLTNLSVAPGIRGKNNRASALPGTIWVNEIPEAPMQISKDITFPSGGYPVISMVITDNGNQHDRAETLFVEAEIRSLEGTILHTYNQGTSLSEWYPRIVSSGNNITLTVPDQLPDGVYAWRARVKDESIYGPWSDLYVFSIGDLPGPPTPALSIERMVRITFVPEPGTPYVLQQSLDGVTWEDAQQIPSINGTSPIELLMPASGPYQFFRLR